MITEEEKPVEPCKMHAITITEVPISNITRGMIELEDDLDAAVGSCGVCNELFVFADVENYHEGQTFKLVIAD